MLGQFNFTANYLGFFPLAMIRLLDSGIGKTDHLWPY